MMPLGSDTTGVRHQFRAALELLRWELRDGDARPRMFLRRQRAEAVAVNPEVLRQGLVGDAELGGVVGVFAVTASRDRTR